MVDFNNEATISTPAVDIVRVLILQRHSDALDAIEFYKKKTLGGVAYPTDVMASRIYSLYLQNIKPIQRNISKEDFKQLEKDVNSIEEADLIKAFLIINGVLDELRLTKIDTGKKHDTTNVEEENHVKGL